MDRFRPYSLEEGRALIKLARKAVTVYIEEGKIVKPSRDVPERLLRDNYGVFTTIEKLINGRRELRGCIGYPRGYTNVATAIVSSALAAAFEDPRFPPLSQGELNEIVFEVSVLSPLERIRIDDPRRLPETIRVGYHGLVIEHGIFSGLLLPQVAVEYGWDEETFLCQTCMKAGLTPECWLDRRTTVYRFQAQIFAEKNPDGEIVERDLLGEMVKREKGS